MKGKRIVIAPHLVPIVEAVKERYKFGELGEAANFIIGNTQLEGAQLTAQFSSADGMSESTAQALSVFDELV